MQCNSNHSQQILTNADNQQVIGAGILYLRYPHEQRDKIPGHAEDVSKVEVQKIINSYNMFKWIWRTPWK